MNHGQTVAVRLQHSEIGNGPIAAIEDEDVGHSVAIEVADEELIAAGELPARHRTVVAGDELEAAAAVIGEQTQIGITQSVPLKTRTSSLPS